MIGMSQKNSGKLLASIAAASLAIMPMIVYADASAPGAVKVQHKKAMTHKRKHRAKAVAHHAAPQPTQVAQADPAPVYQAPAPVPEPAPVAAPEPAPMPAPAPAAPAAPAPVVAAHHGSSALLGILGAAAVIGGIIAVASGGSPASP
jgi:hypothetical protein